MKTQIKYFLVIAILFTTVLSSCGEDEPDVQTYKIKVTNITASDVDIFISSNGGSSFSNKGSIPSGEFREYDLALNVSYTLRASLQGETAEDFFNEQQISNSNPDVISMNFDITN